MFARLKSLIKLSCLELSKVFFITNVSMNMGMKMKNLERKRLKLVNKKPARKSILTSTYLMIIPALLSLAITLKILQRMLTRPFYLKKSYNNFKARKNHFLILISISRMSKGIAN